MRCCFMSLCAVALCLCLAPLNAQNAPLDQVRHAYYNEDDAASLLKTLVVAHSDSVDLQHWNLALGDLTAIHSDFQKADRAAPKDAWTLLARARYASPWEKPVLLNAAIAAAPTDPDILVLATEQMRNTLFESTDKEQTAAFRAALAAFLSLHAAGYEKSAHALAARAAAENGLAQSTEGAPVSAAPNGDILALADRALALDPKEVQAVLVKAALLTKDGDKRASHDLLRRLVNSGSDSVALYRAYVNAVLSDPQLGKEDQRKELISATTALLARGEPGKWIVTTLLRSSQAAGADTSAAIGDSIARRYPNSVAADTVLFMQATLNDPMIATEPGSPEKVQALEEYLDRPQHPDPDTVLQARSWLLSDMSLQDKPDLDRLYHELTLPHESEYSDWNAVTKLAEQKSHLPEIQRIAEKHLDEEMGLVPGRMLKQSDKQGFMYFSIGYFVAPWQNALGLIYLNQGKLDQAQEKLEAVLKTNPNSLQATLRLGKVYESQGKNLEAEKLFLAAMELSSIGPEEHPAVKALHDNYLRRHSDGTGLDAYMKDIVQKDLDRRRNAVLKARNGTPTPLPSFTLKTLDGKTLTSAETRGKVVVINFWATWCGPCREEMPEFEKLWQKYRNDPAVLVASMATDSVDTPIATIANYIASHKYDFPVLLGPAYATDNSVTPIPMSWFISPNGDEIYRKVGYTKELVQEFSWRIESMRSPDHAAAIRTEPSVH